jgi:cell wall-associated NlpC family hydrolase
MSEEQIRQKRQAILDLAQRLAKDGAHYLWGGNGDRPGEGDVKLANAVLDPANPQNTIFCAASNQADGRTNVCAGRFRAPGLPPPPSPATDRLALAKGATVNSSSPAMQALLKFIDQYKTRPNSQTAWGFDLTPRVLLGSGIIDYGAGGKDITGSVVWGEGCQGTQHFDCAGFVRHVVLKVCGVSIAGITDGAARAMAANVKEVKAWGAPVGTLLAEGDPMEPADILIYPGHIAFAIAGPGVSYRKAAPYAVAQADCACFGVNYNVVHAQASTACVRLSSRVLINM